MADSFSDFVILTADSPNDLAARVMRYRDEGWLVQGGVTTVPVDSARLDFVPGIGGWQGYKLLWAIAMVKP